MKQREQFQFLPALGGAIAGWLAMIIPFGIWMLAIPHGPGFAPEIGPLGSFIYFGAGMTGVFFADYLVVLVALLAFRVRYSSAAKAGIVWGAAFAASVPVWFAYLGGSEPVLLASLFEAPFAFLSGFTAGYSLHRLTKQKKEPNQAAQTTPGLRPSVSDL